MSKHIFTVEVICDSSEDYEIALDQLNQLGDILDEESDFA